MNSTQEDVFEEPAEVFVAPRSLRKFRKNK